MRQALALAGGPTHRAATNRIEILRTVDGKEHEDSRPSSPISSSRVTPSTCRRSGCSARMRIVHLVSSGQLGGTEASVIEMVTSVLAAQPSWRIRVTTSEHGAFEQKLEDAGVPVDVRPFPKRFARIGETGRTGGRCPAPSCTLLGALPGIASVPPAPARRALRGRARPAADIVHAHGFKMQVLGAISMPARARLVWHLHDYVSGRLVSAPLCVGWRRAYRS